MKQIILLIFALLLNTSAHAVSPDAPPTDALLYLKISVGWPAAGLRKVAVMNDGRVWLMDFNWNGGSRDEVIGQVPRRDLNTLVSNVNELRRVSLTPPRGVPCADAPTYSYYAIRAGEPRVIHESVNCQTRELSRAHERVYGRALKKYLDRWERRAR